MAVGTRITSEHLQQRVMRVLEAAISARRFALTLAELLERVLAIAQKRIGLDSESALVSLTKRLRLDDLYLAQACARGEEAAWEEFARAHFTFIGEFAQRSMAGSIEAEDLAQQVIADLWQRGKIGMYEGLSALRTWLGTVIAFAARNAIARARTTIPLQDEVQHEVEKYQVDLPDEYATSRKLIVEAVKQIIAGLPPKEKLLLLLYYEQGLKLREMTAVYHITEASVSRQLKALRERIRDQVQAKLKRELGLGFAAAQELMAHLPADLDFDLQRLLKQ
ncbi:MAG: sigma-70 family RNA polymerase sigma factor [Acidobacteria bacterium]|nr:sigma-70 family RNA polymerase sigma factor [Acidobacteriota bacterium]